MPTILTMRRLHLAVPAPRHNSASRLRPEINTVTPPPPLLGEGELHIHVSMRNNYTVVYLAGEIDMATLENLDTTLNYLLQETEPHLVVDMGGIIFIGAGGFNSLWRVATRAANQGGWLRLARLTARSQRVLDYLRPTYPGQLSTYETIFAAVSDAQLPA